MGNYLFVPELVFLFGVLVFFHELGHFILFKIIKVRVEEFAFGFGPTWIRLFKRGDTEYTIHAVPLGGFCRPAGENPGEPVVPGGFTSKPWYQRYLVYLAGPLASFLLAYVVFCTLGMTVGLPITGRALNVVDGVMQDSEAERAGLRIGDQIVAIDNRPVSDGKELVSIVHSSAGKHLALTVHRDDETIVLHGTPKISKLKNAKGVEEKVGLLGFWPKQELKRVSVQTSVKYGTLQTWQLLQMVLVTVFSKDVANNVGGPLSIAVATKQSAKRGAGGFMELIAMLSLSLGVFNLLPIPIVDGGQMVLCVVEGIIRRKLSDRTVIVAQFVGLMIIMLLFVSIMYLDLNRGMAGKLLQ